MFRLFIEWITGFLDITLYLNVIFWFILAAYCVEYLACSVAASPSHFSTESFFVELIIKKHKLASSGFTICTAHKPTPAFGALIQMRRNSGGPTEEGSHLQDGQTCDGCCAFTAGTIRIQDLVVGNKHILIAHWVTTISRRVQRG